MQIISSKDRVLKVTTQPTWKAVYMCKYVNVKILGTENGYLPAHGA